MIVVIVLPVIASVELYESPRRAKRRAVCQICLQKLKLWSSGQQVSSVLAASLNLELQLLRHLDIAIAAHSPLSRTQHVIRLWFERRYVEDTDVADPAAATRRSQLLVAWFCAIC